MDNSITKYGVNNLRLVFPATEKLFFSNLDFNYQAGESVLLIGPNGCGKSTLLQVLAGLVPEYVELIAKWDELVVSPHLAYCLQDPEAQINMPYCDEEIAFILENKQIDPQLMPELIKHYCQTVGLRLDNLHFPVNQLSGGNKQKLQLAALLALESQVLFLDEPTAMLDPQATYNFWHGIKEKFANKTLVIVEHKIADVIDFISKIVVLDVDGTIRAVGKPEQIFQQQKDYLEQIGVWHPQSWLEHSAEKVLTQSSSKLLTLENFTVYRRKTAIVTAKQFTVETGQWIAIVGSNGAGKSTLLQGIVGLERTKGSCVFNNISQQDCGFVFQNPEYQFVTDKVIDELAYSLQFGSLSVEQQEQKVNEFLQIFNLTKLQQRHPFSLSMGEKRRLSVATALITNPALLMLDEPTLGLDAVNTFSLLKLLQQFQRNGTSILMITHDLDIAHKYANRVWHIEQNQVIELTSEQQLIELKEVGKK